MVCRQNRLSSVIMALARSESWLDDSQVQSIIHRLRHEYDEHNPGQTWGRDRVGDQIHRARMQIQRSPQLRPQRREGLARRLEQGAAEADSLLPGMAWALQRLPNGVAMAEAALASRLREIAGPRGMSMREARAEFFELRSQAPSGRQPRATAEERADLGVIPSDPATRFALSQMTSRDPVLPPVRLTQRWTPVTTTAPAPGVSTTTTTATDTNRATATAVGVSDLSNRIEVQYSDGSTRAYSPADDGMRHLRTRMDHSNTMGAINLEAALAGSENIPRVEQTAHAVRCDDCGQFIGELPHECPGIGTRASTLTHYASGGDRNALLTAPPVEDVRRLLYNSQAVRAPITYVADGVRVEGEVILRPGPQTVRADPSSARHTVDLDEVAEGELTCRVCHSNVEPCSHVVEARSVIRQRYREAGRLSEATEADGILAARGLGVTVEERPEAPPEATPDSVRDASTGASDTRTATVLFREDPAAFRRIIDEARERQQADGLEHLPVPLLVQDDALDPSARDTSPTGTRFGLEIEFNGPGIGNTAAARLHEAGIVRYSTMDGYHSNARNGYRDWGLERDASVAGGGELVTAVLTDSQTAWSSLDAACRVLRGVGATTRGAGCHTNISAAGYSPENAWRLATLVRTHEDDLFRMGRTRGTVRDMNYTDPIRDPGPAWQDWRSSYRAVSRESMVNFLGLWNSSRERQRIEFRFPDASLDPGVMQAQVNLCAAMTNYARDRDPVPGELERRPLGTARGEGWTRRLMAASDGEFAAHTERIRGLIDDLMHTDLGRSQLALLWARGSYHR